MQGAAKIPSQKVPTKSGSPSYWIVWYFFPIFLNWKKPSKWALWESKCKFWVKKKNTTKILVADFILLASGPASNTKGLSFARVEMDNILRHH